MLSGSSWVESQGSPGPAVHSQPVSSTGDGLRLQLASRMGGRHGAEGSGAASRQTVPEVSGAAGYLAGAGRGLLWCGESHPLWNWVQNYGAGEALLSQAVLKQREASWPLTSFPSISSGPCSGPVGRHSGWQPHLS